MKLIDFQGLNCYQNSLVTIAASLGVEYTRAFFNLWPETDFNYDQDHQVYITKRMLENLVSLGVALEAHSFASGEEALAVLSAIDPGEPFLVCVDTFHLPWSPGFGAIHDAHYFAARKEPSGLLSCFDPTHHMQYTMRSELTPLFFKIYRVAQTEKTALQTGDCRDEVLREHPQTRSRLLYALDRCKNAERRETLLLAKYVDAMISNRYLYQHYLNETAALSPPHRPCFDKDFFARWEAVKYGLYRTLVVRDRADTIAEIAERVGCLMDEELSMAASG